MIIDTTQSKTECTVAVESDKAYYKFNTVYLGPNPHRWRLVITRHLCAESAIYQGFISNEQLIRFIDNLEPQSNVVILPNGSTYQLRPLMIDLGKVCLYETYTRWLCATGFRDVPNPQPFHIKSYGELCDTPAGVESYYRQYGHNLYKHGNCPITDCSECKEHWETVGKFVGEETR